MLETACQPTLYQDGELINYQHSGGRLALWCSEYLKSTQLDKL
ncbi:hypothetical protein K661_00407 [Piscirickettsia salmonis LF-89 = ATCC VR-1361]|nr:hypothetical protein K661_00407 [Piscirickettsia salmonis LF-89 = ATCC VR-1361]